MTGTGGWDHSNVFAGGGLLATYSGTDTHFAFNDWLGTKRAELRVSDGCLQTYASLPFGDKLTPAGNCPDATEQHFTGQQRDRESGNDYFQARYYGSPAGRFMSPDPPGIGLADPTTP
jgi:RHS repeat-associated protein